MGCCWGKNSSTDAADVAAQEQEMSVTNHAVLCKAGLKGEKVDVQDDPKACGYRVSGSGTLVGSCALDCDIAYWEVILGKNPERVSVGVKRLNAKRAVVNNGMGTLNKTLENTEQGTFWILDREKLAGVELKEGTCIGVHFDQSDLPMLSFTIDGKLYSNASISRIRPTQDLIAAVSVDDKASATVIFNEDGFTQKPWAGKFRAIVASTSLI
mgnify:CR=1 FL=1|jgi:hypothetical protein